MAARKSNKNKKRGFTDRMYRYNVAFVAVVVVLSFAAMFLSRRLGITDLSPISTIVPSAFAELGIHSGFMIWKAKCENARKYKDVNVTQDTGVSDSV